jgi:antirestriction protein ArdC
MRWRSWSPNSGPLSSAPDLRIADEPRADHAQYLASWLEVMKADKKAIFTAASKASEAAAFLAALQGA